jgi:LysM repeat protein
VIDVSTKRLVIIKNEDMNSEMTLPVTPSSFQVSHGINIETINIHTLGDVAIAGYPTLATIKLELMLPAQYYPFNNFRETMQPYYYIDLWQKYIDNRANLRYVVSGTSINLPVYMESIDYGEQDGTNDVYVTMTLHERKELKAVQVQTTSKSINLSRSLSSGKVTTTEQSYTIKSGDTLSAISKKYYGSVSYYSKLAAYNGIKNPNLIYAGSTIKIPPKGQL